MSVDDKKLFDLLVLAKEGNTRATFEIILMFEKYINKQCYINGKFNQECKDYIEDKVFEYIEKFKTIKEIKKILK